MFNECLYIRYLVQNQLNFTSGFLGQITRNLNIIVRMDSYTVNFELFTQFAIHQVLRQVLKHLAVPCVLKVDATILFIL